MRTKKSAPGRGNDQGHEAGRARLPDPLGRHQPTPRPESCQEGFARAARAGTAARMSEALTMGDVAPICREDEPAQDWAAKRLTPKANPRGRHASERAALRSSADEARIQDRLNQMPRWERATYKRAMAGTSRQAAMDAFCSMCVGWDRKEVTLCSDPACPLFPYRKVYADPKNNSANETTML